MRVCGVGGGLGGNGGGRVGVLFFSLVCLGFLKEGGFFRFLGYGWVLYVDFGGVLCNWLLLWGVGGDGTGRECNGFGIGELGIF